MAKTKKKHSGKPRGMNYADMLARKRMIRSASCGNIRRSIRILTKYSDKVRRYLAWRYGITDREGKH